MVEEMSQAQPPMQLQLKSSHIQHRQPWTLRRHAITESPLELFPSNLPICSSVSLDIAAARLPSTCATDGAPMIVDVILGLCMYHQTDTAGMDWVTSAAMNVSSSRRDHSWGVTWLDERGWV